VVGFSVSGDCSVFNPVSWNSTVESLCQMSISKL
jgi:hypothetical protein